MWDSIDCALNAFNPENYLSIHEFPNILKTSEEESIENSIVNKLAFLESIDEDALFIVNLIKADLPELYSDKTDKITKYMLRKYLKKMGWSERKISRIFSELGNHYKMCFEEY